jgi:hypothetical protein
VTTKFVVTNLLDVERNLLVEPFAQLYVLPPRTIATIKTETDVGEELEVNIDEKGTTLWLFEKWTIEIVAAGPKKERPNV